MHTFQWLLNVHAALKDLQTFLIRFHRISLDLLRDLSCGCQMSNQWARFVNFVDLSSLPALDIWILWTWRRKSDPNNVKDKQIFEAIRKDGMIKRILLFSTFWEVQLFTTNSNYKISTSTIESTVTINFTSIDVSLWLEVWQEMWWAGEGERPTMELEKLQEIITNYKQLTYSRHKKLNITVYVCQGYVRWPFEEYPFR